MKIFSLLPLIVFALVSALTISAQEMPPESRSGWTKGDPNAAVKIEVFNDYQCPTCAVFNEKLKNLEKKFPNDLQITYSHFPLTVIHDKAMLAARSVEAAGRQEKFAEMMDLIFDQQPKWSSKKPSNKIFIKYAKRLGLDVKKFKADLESQSVKDAIEADIRRGKSLDLKGTPTVFLNGRKLGFEELDELERLSGKILSK